MAVKSSDGIGPSSAYNALPCRRFSALLSRSSRSSLVLQAVSCCFLRLDRSFAIEGVGRKPIPLMPSPSSSGSSIKWPVISESFHVKADRSNQLSAVGPGPRDFDDVVVGPGSEELGKSKCIASGGGGDLMPRAGGKRFFGGCFGLEDR